MSRVIDASVAFKWFVPEVNDQLALALLDSDEPFWAPDHIFAEIGNAMWSRLRKIEDGLTATLAAQRELRRVITHIVPTPTLVPRATEIAFAACHSLYDCIYLALCERERVELITADAGLVGAAKRAGMAHLVKELA